MLWKNNLLRIPMIVDLVIQQTIAQVLNPIFEEKCSDNSYDLDLIEVPIKQS